MLILVRHGQTEANARRVLLGRDDPPLTDLGRRQAAAVASVASPALVISSPLRRCRETAEVFGLPVQVDERWIEVDYGEYEGQPLSDLPSEVFQRWRSDLGFVPPGGESLAQVGARVAQACEELAARAATDDIVVVSHVSPIKSAVAWSLGVGGEIAWRAFLDVAAVCRISVGPTGPVLHAYNEVHHLGTVS